MEARSKWRRSPIAGTQLWSRAASTGLLYELIDRLAHTDSFVEALKEAYAWAHTERGPDRPPVRSTDLQCIVTRKCRKQA